MKSFKEQRPLLELSHIKFSYKKNKDFTLEIPNYVFYPHDFYFLTGAPGCGKTTFLKILSKQISPSSGQIRFFFPDSIVAQTFQHLLLIEELSAKENILLIFNKSVHGDKKRLLEEAFSFWEILELPVSGWNRPVFQLSGGQKQLVSLIRCLMIQAPAIFLDEPTGQLGPKLTQKIFELFWSKTRESSSFVVWATHDVQLVKTFHQKAIHLEQGKILGQGFGCFI